MKKKITLLALLNLTVASALFGHNPNATGPAAPLREWHLRGLGHVHGSFLMMKKDSVFLETADGRARGFALASFSAADRDFIQQKEAAIERLNRPVGVAKPAQTVENQLVSKKENRAWLGWLAGLGLLGGLFFFQKRKLRAALAVGGAAALLAFKSGAVERMLGTDPLFVDSAFAPFKPNVATHWDGTWFYVESKGIPATHPMMAGIVKWQQQVPIPQCYLGANAWQIPLNPVVAAQPVPVNQQHFLRGAVAVAANGVPIFNPYTNTGVDAFLDGQLDQWGGHCGRADDYHYHIAPLFLDTQTVEVLPIAFALDGFAVYADHEPDGSPMLPLDGNHGHFDASGGYHYHDTPAAPYMIGKMIGQVTEDTTLQIVPQAHAQPVRPAQTPLSGATITGCMENATGNGYTLIYTKGGQTFQVEYSWTAGGVYTFNFVSPTGTTTETHNGHKPCELPTAIDGLAENGAGLTVFPNPATGRISLKINGLEAGGIRRASLFDPHGRLVLQKDRPGMDLDLGGVARGFYLLKIETEKGFVSRKIVVQ